MTRRTARLAALGALAAAAAFASPPAHASSLVYMKDGDVWLAAPDGSHESRLTNDRRHWSPSQADDGTIVAGFGNTAFVRMSRRGAQLGEPVETFLGAPAGDGTFKGPWDAKVSPDGTKIAYSYTWDHTEFDWGCGCYAWSTIDATAVSWSNRFTAPSELGELRGWSIPSWIDDAHLLAFTPNATEGVVDSIATHTLGGPSGDVLYNANWYSEPGLSTLMDGELSRQGTRLAAMGGLGSDPKTLRVYSVAGAPPYRDGEAGAAVTLACVLDIGAPLWASPTWSPDGTQLAWVQEDGIHSATVGDLGRGCAALTGQRLLVPGGSAPDWGPADVPAPEAAPAGPGTGGGTPGGSGSGGTGGGATAATFSPAGAQRLAAALARGLRMRVTARRAVTLRLAATIEPRLARRLGLRGGGGVVASRAVTFTGAGTATVALRFTPRARQALRSLRRVSLRVTLRAQGGAALAARTVTLAR